MKLQSEVWSVSFIFTCLNASSCGAGHLIDSGLHPAKMGQVTLPGMMRKWLAKGETCRVKIRHGKEKKKKKKAEKNKNMIIILLTLFGL